MDAQLQLTKIQYNQSVIFLLLRRKNFVISNIHYFYGQEGALAVTEVGEVAANTPFVMIENYVSFSELTRYQFFRLCHR